ncbi:hypothetical protein B4135_1389 [Caldibacillus debilis]|uniref:Uncharacterized protein n=1 Tax=Caldibacillus debilis TaxID=301148 RepID=A0A150MDB5_9BACI|nr:hypothetical protein B4135_1389 [Caldibacillus debilis]
MPFPCPFFGTRKRGCRIPGMLYIHYIMFNLSAKQPVKREDAFTF